MHWFQWSRTQSHTLHGLAYNIIYLIQMSYNKWISRMVHHKHKAWSYDTIQQVLILWTRSYKIMPWNILVKEDLPIVELPSGTTHQGCKLD